jgi:mono/diheme cytochrome c family protein
MSRFIGRALATASVFALTVSSVELVSGREAGSVSVFTTEQAKTGKAAYVKNCASCHLPDLSGSNEIPALAGKPFKDAWGSRTTKDLLDYMSAAMPYGGPSLPAETYLSILAYILQSNGAVTGSEALSATTSVRMDGLMTAD